ncbi:MAG: NADH-quinone oxidoreductase subunit C [Planctomycetes bacterium]|nr:NADH-quinone oxidoreductase subunit C [Planctomycetota bacterium]
MKEPVIDVTPAAVGNEVRQMKDAGWRLVGLSGAMVDDEQIDILYHFDKDLTLSHFRLRAPRTAPLPSISAVYSAAFLGENELQDLFAVRFENLVPDFKRTLYLEEEITTIPFATNVKAAEKKT